MSIASLAVPFQASWPQHLRSPSTAAVGPGAVRRGAGGGPPAPPWATAAVGPGGRPQWGPRGEKRGGTGQMLSSINLPNIKRNGFVKKTQKPMFG